jgi:type IV secretory pathway TrbD component
MQIEIPAQYCADIRRSANKPLLLMGCDPLAIIAVGMLSLFVAFSVTPMRYGIGGALAVFFVGRQLLHTLAKKDPFLLRVYQSNRRYARGFWTAQSSTYGLSPKKGVISGQAKSTRVL